MLLLNQRFNIHYQIREDTRYKKDKEFLLSFNNRHTICFIIMSVRLVEVSCFNFNHCQQNSVHNVNNLAVICSIGGQIKIRITFEATFKLALELICWPGKLKFIFFGKNMQSEILKRNPFSWSTDGFHFQCRLRSYSNSV